MINHNFGLHSFHTRRLYQKMFQVLNTQYSFDDNYLQCVGKLMDELKPFGDIPKKLKIEVKRSFVATRTFVQALSNGKDVLANIIEVSRPVPVYLCVRTRRRLRMCAYVCVCAVFPSIIMVMKPLWWLQV